MVKCFRNRYQVMLQLAKLIHGMKAQGRISIEMSILYFFSYRVLELENKSRAFLSTWHSPRCEWPVADMCLDLLPSLFT